MRTEDIINQVFTRSFMGYDIEQVDLFLDEVIAAIERYESEKREMLAAMEYLMKKLEHGQKMPLSDMKKAIDSERLQPAKNLPASPDEAKATARSIVRGGAGTTKPMRAPKVNRVKSEDDIKAQMIIQEAKAAMPQTEDLTPEQEERRAKKVAAAASSWLDELLINIAEHETTEHNRILTVANTIPAEQPHEKAAEATEEPQESQKET